MRTGAPPGPRSRAPCAAGVERAAERPRRARASRSARGRRCGAVARPPSSVTSSSSASGAVADRHASRRAPPAWRTTFVTASCTIRYADASRPGASARGAPSTASVIGTPAARAPSTTSSSSSRPGCGASSASLRRTAASVHLAHRAPPERGDRVRALVAGDRGERLGLHDHQRDVVADRVVQLARDPQPLLGRGVLGQQLALARRRRRRRSDR